MTTAALTTSIFVGKIDIGSAAVVVAAGIDRPKLKDG